MKSLLIAFAFVTFASSAHADVGAYRWGMTRSQVLAAGQGNIHSVQGVDGDRVFGSDLGAEGKYSAAGVDFKAQLYFDPAGRLAAVRLHPDNMSQCNRVLEILEGLYGLGNRTGMGKNWVDSESNNDLRFTSLDGECFIAYRPVSRSGGLGL